MKSSVIIEQWHEIDCMQYFGVYTYVQFTPSEIDLLITAKEQSKYVIEVDEAVLLNSERKRKIYLREFLEGEVAVMADTLSNANATQRKMYGAMDTIDNLLKQLRRGPRARRIE